MKSFATILAILALPLAACFAQEDRLERLRQIQSNSPQPIVASPDEQIILNEATAIIADHEALLKRESEFPGDIEGIREALTALQKLLKQPTPSPMQTRAANLTAKEKELHQERQNIVAELQSVMSTLMGGECEKCGPGCECGPNCDCVNGECLDRTTGQVVPRQTIKPTVRQQTIPVNPSRCATTGLPYVHDGCNCRFCQSKRPKQSMGGITVMPYPTNVTVNNGSGQVTTPTANVRWELVPGSCNSPSGCRWRQVR